MKIMFRAVESTAAKGYGGKKDYDNPNFRMQMASSAGAPIRSMIISGGMKGGVLPGMLEMANGHFFRGIWKMLTGGEKMPSLYACMMNLVFRCMAQDKPGQPHDYAAERKRNDRKPPRPAKGVTVRLGELGGLSAEFIQQSGNQKGTIFYIHGGGFIVVSVRERRAVCQYITANYGYNCVTFNYRLAPENLWSAPLEGCLTAYAARLKTGASPKDVVFMGESTGGTLVLSLALLLKEKGFPQPKRWCLSPPV
jgi:acetyl esterase/lipase